MIKLSDPTVVTQQSVVADGGAIISEIHIFPNSKNINVTLDYLDVNGQIVKKDMISIADSPEGSLPQNDTLTVSGGKVTLSKLPNGTVNLYKSNGQNLLVDHDFTISGSIITIINSTITDGMVLTANYGYSVPASNAFTTIVSGKTSGGTFYNDIKTALYNMLISMGKVNGSVE